MRPKNVLSRPHRRHFSRLGLGLVACLAANYAAAVVVSVVFSVLDALGVLSFNAAMDTVLFWSLEYVLPGLLGLWLFLRVVRPLPALQSPQRRPLSPLALLKAYLVSAASLFLFGFLTDLLLSLIAALRGVPVTNPVNDFFELPPVISFLLTCVVAPVLEELTYRRLLIPRLRPYGDRFAVFASALCFALMHGNLSQFFYAFALGVILSHVFLKTGCVWQTILLHALVNLAGGVIPSLAVSFGAVGAEFYLRFTLCHIGAGLFCFLRRARYVPYSFGVHPLTEGRKWRLLLFSPGMLCFCLLCLLQAAVYLMQ